MRKYVFAAVAIALFSAVVALPNVILAGGPPVSATMQYGRPDLGSGCNFPCEDDQSFHAVDAIQPGAVTISVGGTVHFDVAGFHQVAVFPDGTMVSDVVLDPGAFPFVDDLAGAILAPPTVSADFTFNSPGRYLVICNIAPHFEGAQMWGWVNVR